MRSMVGRSKFMSRVGKKPILIPKGVEVKIEGKKVKVKGEKGGLEREVRPEVKVEVKDSQVFVTPDVETKQTSSLWGLTRQLINNMVEGVTKGYEKKLEIEGLGFKAALEGENLVLSVGFSHPVKIEAPKNIKFSVEKNVITVSGVDKELVGQTAAVVKRVKKPEPYKGKGIRYFREKIRRKEGKKAVATK
ncbi:MAG: large subunit ribosomal protein L6 [Parcubacteria group bacterium Gr01-1014_30]|nr:MAG: large subunit ribosomal protein L6 [Parcubacteria group bacterium Gr01-1014_30]